MKDYKPRATPSMFDEFMKTAVYADFREELLTRIEDFRDLLEVSEATLTPGITHESIRGATALARQVLNIFVDLKLNAQEDLKREDDDV